MGHPQTLAMGRGVFGSTHPVASCDFAAALVLCTAQVLCILLCASHHTMQQEQTLAGTPWLRLETYTLGIAVFTIHNKLSVMMHDSLIR